MSGTSPMPGLVFPAHAGMNRTKLRLTRDRMVAFYQKLPIIPPARV